MEGKTLSRDVPIAFGLHVIIFKTLSLPLYIFMKKVLLISDFGRKVKLSGNPASVFLYCQDFTVPIRRGGSFSVCHTPTIPCHIPNTEVKCHLLFILERSFGFSMVGKCMYIEICTWRHVSL